MKWKVAGVLMCVLSLLGCSNDVEKPEPVRRMTVDTPGGKKKVQDPVRDPDGRRFTASVVGEGTDATLRLESTGDGVTTTGLLAELRDPSGNLLFSLEATVNHVTGEVIYTQATSEDYMTNRIIADDERVWEQYDANGDVATFEYPALSDETQRHAVNAWEHNSTPAHLPADVSEYIAQVGAFDAYYAPHSANTLTHNTSGELLVQILTSPELPSLVVGETPDSERWRWVEHTCATARACVTLVCRTHPGSLVCGVCWGIAVICTIFDLIASWSG